RIRGLVKLNLNRRFRRFDRNGLYPGASDFGVRRIFDAVTAQDVSAGCPKDRNKKNGSDPIQAHPQPPDTAPRALKPIANRTRTRTGGRDYSRPLYHNHTGHNWHSAPANFTLNYLVLFDLMRQR